MAPMATQKHPAHLTAAELQFWTQAFLAAELPVLLKGKQVSPEGMAHVASEYAFAAVTELRNAKRGTP